MTGISEHIWVLDHDDVSVGLYRETLGLKHEIRCFSSVHALMDALRSTDPTLPHLLVADPAQTNGSFIEALKNTRGAGSMTRALPEYMIVTQLDDLELMRFYLKAGARDYLLKPLRPNELVAKVERVFNQIHSRDVLILCNELDGIQLPDLTFREYQMLTVFLSRPDRSVHRDELYGAIWSKVTVNRKTLDVHLFNLRRKVRPRGYEIVCRDQIFSLQRQ